MYNCTVLYFFGTKTTIVAHADVDGSITPALRVRSISFYSCSRCVGPVGILVEKTALRPL